jgi:hypothetical protein
MSRRAVNQSSTVSLQRQARSARNSSVRSSSGKTYAQGSVESDSQDRQLATVAEQHA